MKVFYSFFVLIVLWIPQQSAARGRSGGVGGGFRGGGGGTHLAPPALGLAAARKPACHPYKRVEVVAGVDGEECKGIPSLGSRRVEGIGKCEPKPRTTPQRITISDVSSIPQVTQNPISEVSPNSEGESEANSTSSSPTPMSQSNNDYINNEIVEEKPAQFNITEVVIECVCEWVMECMENGVGKTGSEISSLFPISTILLITLNLRV